MAEETKVLLINDNDATRHDLETVLSFVGEQVVSASSANWHSTITEAVSKPQQVCLALINDCQQLDTLQLLKDLHAWEPGLPFVLIGEQQLPEQLDADLQSRITATLPEALSHQPLLDAIHKSKLFHEHYNRLRDFGGVRDYNMFRSLVGRSDPIQRVRHMMGQVANTEVSVLITGESGTGKEVVARNLHLNSARADKPFVPINCGAIPRELLESELFGHEKGAFTGAISSRVGRFELADGGTLFLDEIGDMPLTMQVKLLRVLQERSFERVGGVKTIQTDVRILAATHKDLEKMIDEGEFRQDLFYRINVFPIEMPSLRERATDVPLLLNELITAMEAEGRGSVRFNSGAIASLCRHNWPGNVRELANLVERMAILHPHGIVGLEDLPKKFLHLSDQEINEASLSATSLSQNSPSENSSTAAQSVVPIQGLSSSVSSSSGSGSPGFLPPDGGSLLPLHGMDLKEYLANLEKDLIEQALDDSGGVVARAAHRLQIRRTTLVEKMRKYQLQRRQTEAEVGAESESESESESKLESEDQQKADAASSSHEDPDQAASA
ncbi:MAG: sigma-54-dependent Fis family transcriptional regulator [Pseudomonadales bacterium]|nr:sigma-54-dependent Fis family transcriptional regulator [Pseudomonadales bacterium]